MNKTLMLLIQLQNLILAGDDTVRRRIDCLRSYVSREHVMRFDNLLNQGRPAVVTLTETGVCRGCQFRLALAASLTIRRSRSQLHICQNCGCFLYSANSEGRP